jgi:hypothetical protein
VNLAIPPSLNRQFSVQKFSPIPMALYGGSQYLRRRTKNANTARAGVLVLVLGYLCLVDLLGNIIVRFGWIHVRVPGLNGFSSTIWKAALGAAICLALAWYIERPGRATR